MGATENGRERGPSLSTNRQLNVNRLEMLFRTPDVAKFRLFLLFNLVLRAAKSEGWCGNIINSCKKGCRHLVRFERLSSDIHSYFYWSLIVVTATVIVVVTVLCVMKMRLMCARPQRWHKHRN